MRKQELYTVYLQARLDRALKRMYDAESDSEYENNRQTVLALQALIDYELRRVA